MHTMTIKSDKPLVLIPADEYESMKETLELLAANPALPEELAKQRESIVQGNFITWKEFKTQHKVK